MLNIPWVLRGSGSPEGIRTLVADLRSQSPRPLDDGAALFHLELCTCAVISTTVTTLLRWGTRTRT